MTWIDCNQSKRKGELMKSGYYLSFPQANRSNIEIKWLIWGQKEPAADSAVKITSPKVPDLIWSHLPIFIQSSGVKKTKKKELTLITVWKLLQCHFTSVYFNFVLRDTREEDFLCAQWSASLACVEHAEHCLQWGTAGAPQYIHSAQQTFSFYFPVSCIQPQALFPPLSPWCIHGIMTGHFGTGNLVWHQFLPLLTPTIASRTSQIIQLLIWSSKLYGMLKSQLFLSFFPLLCTDSILIFLKREIGTNKH